MDIIKNFKRNKIAFLGSILRRISFLIKDDEMYLKLLYLIEIHKWPDLKHPQSFNEKLQWLKIHSRNPLYTTMVDKYAVKEYVAKEIGKQHIIQTLGVWNGFEEINFKSLPNKFVLKTTHGGGNMAVVICQDKSTFDINTARKCLQHSLQEDVYMKWREWPYKDVPKRIIAETYIESNGTLKDYKIHCFNGEPRFILVCQGRNNKTMDETFYTPQWEKMEIARPKHPTPDIARPSELEEMLILARKLSKDIPFIRVDFYANDGCILFGELTFYPASGLSKFTPEKWDKTFGEWLEIHKNNSYSEQHAL